MQENYNPKIIEKKIQDEWAASKTFKASINKRKNSTVCLCFLIQVEIFILVMSETIQ